jgi:hypothetical protein
VEGATGSCPWDFPVAEDARKAAESTGTMRTEESTGTGTGNTTKNQGASPPARRGRTKIAWVTALAAFSLVSTAGGSTNVSGTMVNQTWTSNNSPYIVVGPVTVAGLTINPGVTVRFAGNYTFEVDGVLKANGTPTSPIVFMGTNGGWQGIYFNYSSPGSVLANCVISNSINSGVRIVNSCPLLNNCIIAGNSATSNGGGISVSNVNTTGVVLLLNCLITSNTCGLNGGGICAALGTNGLLDIVGCIVSDNIANPSAIQDGSYHNGGGIYVSGSSLIKYCVVQGNLCLGPYDINEGGGIYSDTGVAAIRNCIVSGNSCPDSTSWNYGGGIYVNSGSIVMTNSVISSNAVSSARIGEGGGVFIWSSVNSASIVNCTIAYNNIEGLWSGLNAAQVMNSILFFNNSDGTQIIGTTNVTYCDVQNGFTGTGNIDGNPIFLSASDLIIVSASPCINKGNTNIVYNNVYFPPSLGTKHNDIGAHGGPGAGASMGIEAWPPVEVFFYGGVPGYNYLIQGSTNLSYWQTLEEVQITNLGDIACYLEPSTNTLPRRFYKLNLAP